MLLLAIFQLRISLSAQSNNIPGTGSTIKTLAGKLTIRRSVSYWLYAVKGLELLLLFFVFVSDNLSKFVQSKISILSEFSAVDGSKFFILRAPVPMIVLGVDGFCTAINFCLKVAKLLRNMQLFSIGTTHVCLNQ